MRQWQGIRDDQTGTGGDGLESAIGVSFFVDGELRRRPGLTKLVQIGAIAMGYYRSTVNGNWLITIDSSGTVESNAI